jgi:hypothetical protein
VDWRRRWREVCLAELDRHVLKVRVSVGRAIEPCVGEARSVAAVLTSRWHGIRRQRTRTKTNGNVLLFQLIGAPSWVEWFGEGRTCGGGARSRQKRLPVSSSQRARSVRPTRQSATRRLRFAIHGALGALLLGDWTDEAQRSIRVGSAIRPGPARCLDTRSPLMLP